MQVNSPGWKTNLLLWMLISCAIALWVITVMGAEIRNLSFIPPFQHLSPLFWVGLLCAIPGALAGTRSQRALSLALLMVYFIATLPVIFEYPILHDSVVNTVGFSQVEKSLEPYGQSYLGMGLILDMVRAFSKADLWQIARYFPIGVGILYLVILAVFCYAWKGILFSSYSSASLFCLFILVFGETFYLRINAAPQTISFLSFFFALAVLPLSYRSLLMKILFLLALGMMVITHPISPILSLPGLAAGILMVEKGTRSAVTHTLEILILVVVGYLGWTLYMGSWVIKQAFLIVQNALTTEKIAPMVTRLADQDLLDRFVLWHRVLLIALLVILSILFLKVIRLKIRWFVLIWGFGLLPSFLLLFSYQDFFDRILLFGLVPCAVVFAEGSRRLITETSWLKIPSAGLLGCLILLSASVAYFYIGAVDRVTADEVQAGEYLASLDKPLTVYSNGFNLPATQEVTYIPATRGIIEMDRAMQADAILITQQMRHAVLLNPRAPMQVEDFITMIQEHFVLVETMENTTLYMKISDSTLVP